MKKIYISLIVSALFMVGFCIGANADSQAMPDFANEDSIYINGVRFYNKDYVSETSDGSVYADRWLTTNSLAFEGNTLTLTPNTIYDVDTKKISTYDIYHTYSDGTVYNKVGYEGLKIWLGGKMLTQYVYVYDRSLNKISLYFGHSGLVSNTNYRAISDEFLQIDVDLLNYDAPVATLELVNFSDPLTSEAYVHVTLPYPVGYLRLSRRYINENGDYDTEVCGGFSVQGVGEHNVTLDKMKLDSPGTYVLSLYNDSTGVLDAMKVFTLSKGYVPNLCMTLHDVPEEGENISSDFGVMVINSNLEAGRLEVIDTESNSIIKTIYLLTFNGLGTGFGNAFQYVDKTTLDLNFTDLGIKSVGSYQFKLYNEAGECVDIQSLSVKGFDYTGSNGIQGKEWDEYDYSGLFKYPEFPTGLNVIDYVIWFCQCIIITFSSVGKVFMNFIESCANFTSMMTGFFSFMPPVFTAVLSIILPVCLIMRLFGR